MLFIMFSAKLLFFSTNGNEECLMISNIHPVLHYALKEKVDTLLITN